MLTSGLENGRRLLVRAARRVVAPYDSYEVQVVDRLSHPAAVPLNKLCGMAELENPEWSKALADLDLDRPNAPFHRKAWEFTQAVYGLRKLKRLSADAVALGIGSGHEHILYFLANKVKEVVATDLYEGSFADKEASPLMVTHPDMFSPFHYRKDHLRVLVMDAMNLDFPDSNFDFVFSFSSIEHFGGHAEAIKALGEMYRVLKPGGVAVISTELILNRLGKTEGFFRMRDVEPVFLNATGFDLVGGKIDDGMEKRFVRNPMEFPYEASGEPCVVLRKGLTLFTSILLFLQKPPREGEGETAATGEERPYNVEHYSHRAEISSPETRLTPGRGDLIHVTLKVRNLGDITWYNMPAESHTVRVGGHLLAEDGECLKWDLARQDLPSSVEPGEETQVALPIRSPHRRGRFTLEIDMVKEGVLWFGEAGSPTLRMPLSVE